MYGRDVRIVLYFQNEFLDCKEQQKETVRKRIIQTGFENRCNRFTEKIRIIYEWLATSVSIVS